MKALSFILLCYLFVLGSCLSDPGTSSLQEQLKSDVAAIDAYLATNSITAYKDASGVRFTIDSLGSGYPPRITDLVTFQYSGKLLYGPVFESATKNFTISNLIAGFQIALPLVPNGSKATFYIPSVYGYGSQSSDKIPANSNLIYQIKLKSIAVTAQEKTQKTTDVAAIEAFVTSNTIANVVSDTSGLRYVITQLGAGDVPTWFNKVKISYTGKLITNGEVGATFYTGLSAPDDTYDSRVVNYIRGFQVGLQQLPKGSKATFYIPSGLAFGAQSSNGGIVSVPANSNLIYEVELMDVYTP